MTRFTLKNPFTPMVTCSAVNIPQTIVLNYNDVRCRDVDLLIISCLGVSLKDKIDNEEIVKVEVAIGWLHMSQNS